MKQQTAGRPNDVDATVSLAFQHVKLTTSQPSSRAKGIHRQTRRSRPCSFRLRSSSPCPRGTTRRDGQGPHRQPLAMTQSWDTMRKEARRLETDIDAKLVDYSKLAASLQSFTTRTSFDSSRGGTEGKPSSHLSSTHIPPLRANRLTCLPLFPCLAAEETKPFNDAAANANRAQPPMP